MFASSGEITPPCGVPTLVSDHWPSSDTPAFNHFWIRRTMRGSPTRCSINFTAGGRRLLGQCSHQQTDFGIQPVRAAGGAVRVKDEVEVQFDIYALPK